VSVFFPSSLPCHAAAPALDPNGVPVPRVRKRDRLMRFLMENLNSIDSLTHILKWGMLFALIVVLLSTGYSFYLKSVALMWILSEALVLWLSLYVARRFVFLSSQTKQGNTKLVMVRRPKETFMGDEPGTLKSDGLMLLSMMNVLAPF
jgi:hypothetical protein